MEKFKNATMNDIFAGIIVAFISIPISMGYAQVAGLPMVYGLYGSLVPILVFSLFTTSHDFVFGVDAAPAALTGSALATLGITAGTKEAMQVVPVIALMVALWLIFFSIIKAGRAVKYISTPVMGGFVTGICLSIIMMLVPKLFGGTTGTGEIFELVNHIIKELPLFNGLSFVLGMSTLVIILVVKRINKKIPMPILMMFIGALLTAIFPLEKYGVKLLPHVDPGLPKLVIPSIAHVDISALFFTTLSIAIVVLAQTLLSAQGNAMKDGYKLDGNKEIFAYGMAELATSLVGCCPTNGSVSRTGLARQYGCKTQVMSLSAAATMALLLLFGTGFIEYLPVPILTAIVITALLGACHFALGQRLFRESRNEFYIFMAACCGVLIFGTIYGVVIGIVLSFLAVVIKAVTPPAHFLGVIPGQTGFFNLEKNVNARPIRHTIIYRFPGNLFFANIDKFQEDIEKAIKEDTEQVIVDASGISNIDFTAIDRLIIFYNDLQKRNIDFYLTRHMDHLNQALRENGGIEIITSGHVRRTMQQALLDCGLVPPYPLEDLKTSHISFIQPELEWAFGNEAEKYKQKMTQEMLDKIHSKTDLSPDLLKDIENHTDFGELGLIEADEFLSRLEMHIPEIMEKIHENEQYVEERLEQYRDRIEEKLHDMNPETLRVLKQYRSKYEKKLQELNPHAFNHYKELHQKHLEKLEKNKK